MLTRYLSHWRRDIQILQKIHLRYTSSKETGDMEQLKSNPYFDKYAQKLAEAEKSSPQAFQKKVDSYFSKTIPEPKTKDISQVTTQKPKETSSYIKSKTLDSVLKVDSVKSLSADEITQIWKLHHQSQDKIAAVIPAKVYETIHERSKEFSTFIFPLPRKDGYEFIMAQFNGHQCHFTTLINFQTHKENSPECLTITHYTEFQEEKGIVLMHGEYNTELFNGVDACFLANQIQLYYASRENSSKYKLLKSFTSNPKDFKHMDLVLELANLTF